MDFCASCGSDSDMTRVASSRAALAFSIRLLPAVYCIVGFDGELARRMLSSLLLPEHAASSAPKRQTTTMRIMAGPIFGKAMRLQSGQIRTSAKFKLGKDLG